MIPRGHPFQKLCHVPKALGRPSFLLAAAGSGLMTFDPHSGNLLQKGPPFEDDVSEAEALPDTLDGPSPLKRRKLARPSLSREASEDSIEIVAERRKGERRKPKVEGSKSPNVSHLTCTSDGRIVISVTVEDKSINTFVLQESGKLALKSQRSMPKRLCSIALSPDEQTIIAADKFGDVYSLPLMATDDFVAPNSNLPNANGSLKPAASELTVHTKGNLEALRQQQKQKNENARKEGPQFEYKLLLGHVSLLTDVAIATDQASSKQHQYIITSDRDEHVRVSRYPQAHIVHTYCLGFGEFVSKICVVPWAPRLVMVGSGEPSLKIFDWQSGRLICQNAFDIVTAATFPHPAVDGSGQRSTTKLAVSGIWPVRCRREGGFQGLESPGGVVLVALEGLPYLYSFQLIADKLEHQQTIPFSGNVLDVAIDTVEETIAYVAIDNVHAPGSMISLEPDADTDPREVLITLEMHRMTLEWSVSKDGFQCKESDMLRLVELLPEPQDQAKRSSRARGEYSNLGEFLYGLENLRKKRGIYAEEVDESVEAPDDIMLEDVS